MKFSLVTVTTDRLPLAERLLRSLAAQTHRDFEVVFAHGAACSAEAQALAGKFAGLDIKILVTKDNRLSRSRNLALPLASGEVIAFPDDDCVYEPDALARCAEVFLRRPRPDVVLARTADLVGDVPAVPSAPQACARPYALFRRSVSYAQFHAKDVVQAVGGFDENMGLGCGTPYQSGEDTDYVLRAFGAGFKIAYAPSVVVRHPAANLRDPGLSRKVEAYAAGRMHLLRKYNMPTWFVLANIGYPLLRIPGECLSACRLVVRHRWRMFAARLGAVLR